MLQTERKPNISIHGPHDGPRVLRAGTVPANEENMLTLDHLYSAAKNDIESYARCRADAVRRGAETPELAGLLTQKYGSGLASHCLLLRNWRTVRSPTCSRLSISALRPSIPIGELRNRYAIRRVQPAYQLRRQRLA